MSAATIGNEDEITCPLCLGKMKDLWDIDPRNQPVTFHCEVCGRPITITAVGTDGTWAVTPE